MRTALLALWIALPHFVLPQGFTGKTSDIHLDFKAEPVFAAIPEIRWKTPAIESSYNSDNNLAVEVEVISELPIKSIEMILKVGENSSVKNFPVEPGQFYNHIKQSIHLLDGNNLLEIVVENIKGGKSSSARSVLVGQDLALQAVDANRRDYALIFCTDKYEHWADLVNPVNDGHTIENLLKEKYGFETEVVENATDAEILSKLYDYNTKKFNFQDQLFIFFAGHGVFDETLGEGYIVASNSLENDRGKTTYIPHAVLRQRIDNIKCEHIFLAMDVCFGGTIDPLLTRRRNIDVYSENSDSEYLVKKLSRRTRKFLTSGSKEYVSDGIPGKHSPFASKFIQALREVGSGKDRLLTLSELEVYFQKLTTEPRSGSFGSDDPASDFVFMAR